MRSKYDIELHSLHQNSPVIIRLPCFPTLVLIKETKREKGN